MKLITPALQTYPWGSKTMLAQLRGEPAPTAQPEAELWFGAHRTAPSLVDGTGLDSLISTDPTSALGAAVESRFGAQLPFLLKILAAEAPLSVQAHPDSAQAQAGFDAENAAGIPLSSAKRNYKDPSHKPELLVALTPFRALAGLRPVADTLALIEHLDCVPLNRYAAFLHSDNEEEGLRALFTTWISLPRAKRLELIDAIYASAQSPSPEAEAWMVEAMACFIELNDRYPGDVGVLASLLLNYIELAPGEALFLGAGCLHAYISGMAVEIMASSDNVLRGGLTSKHVDVPELVRICDFTTQADPRIATSTSTAPYGEATEYPVPIEDFVLTRHRLYPSAGALQVGDGGAGSDAGAGPGAGSGAGPGILLCTKGAVTCGSGEAIDLKAGSAAWIPADDGPFSVRAAGHEVAEVFYARVAL